jgi:hypothetical protein
MPRRPGAASGRCRRNTTNRPARQRRAPPAPGADAPLPVRPRLPCRARKSHLRRSRRVFGKPKPPRGSCGTRLLPVVRRSQTTASLAASPVDHFAPLPRRHPLAETVRSLAPRSVRLVGPFHEVTSNSRPGPPRVRTGDITGTREITRRSPTVSSGYRGSSPPHAWARAAASSIDRKPQKSLVPMFYSSRTVRANAVGSKLVARTRT